MLGERIKKVLRERGMKQVELAKAINVKPQTISYLVKTNAAQSQYVARIAEALGVNPSWLQDGTGEPTDATVRIKVKDTEIRLKTVPLLAFPAVSDWLGGKDVERVDVVTDVLVGAKAFALEIADEAMADILLRGDRVVIDPAQRPRPGDIVCAECGSGVVLRRYRDRGNGSYELVPANADWPSVTSNDEEVRLIGVVVEHRQYRR